MTDTPCRIPIKEIKPDSIAQELGILPGDILVAVNGRCPQDIIDYRYLEADEELILLVESQGELVEMEIEKEISEDLGIIFDLGAFSPIQQCENHCIFCFVDQLPPGMRETLYIKDDDYRYSVVAGNFITLTNLTAEERERIIRQRLSPLHISVHALDPSVRTQMMNHARAGRAREDMTAFAQAQLTMHTQIVLCPGVNDGPVLDDTLKQLGALFPAVASVGVVPVGLTGHRDGLTRLTPVDQDLAGDVIDQIDSWRERFLQEWEYPLVFAADELYAQAGRPLPERPYYEEFPQTENGIGLLRLLLDRWAEEKILLPDRCAPTRLTVVSGASSAGYVETIVDDLNRITGLEVRLAVVPSRFFGGEITVTGLVTGRDILLSLKGEDLGDAVLLPSSMLQDEEDRLLDDYTLESLAETLHTRLVVVDALGEGLARMIGDLCNKGKDE